MADRQVKVTLVAQVSGYLAGMESASRKTKDFANDSTERLARQREAFNVLGRAAFVAGAAVVAGIAVAINKFAEFDQAISNVKAVTQETTANMEKLRAAALDAGGRTVFTATEAANAIEELGKAGISTSDILGGALDGALSLAASGQLEVARAAEITATTLKQYNLAGDQAAHVADVLSAAAGKALGSVEDLAQGLKFVGPVAASMGVSLEETAGALALFADQGLVGEQAGTSLRGVLASLTSPSSQAAKEIERLGISLYDSNGRFLGLENTAGQLANAYRNLDDKSRDASLGIIFGNQQVTAARVLFASGAEKVAQYTAEVNDAGYAARVAADRMDNLRGDLEKLGGALDTALIQTGSGANDTLRSITQGATFLVDQIGGLPGPVLAAGLAIGVVGASAALAGGAALIAVPKWAAFKAALDNTKFSAARTATAVGLAGGAIGAATLIIGAFIDEQARIDAAGEAVRDSLDKTTGAFTQYSREIVAKELQDSGAAATAERLGISLETLTDAVFGNSDAIAEYRKNLPATAGASGQFATDIRKLNREFEGLAGKVSEAPDQLKALQQATDDASDSSARNADELKGISAAASDAGNQIQDLSDLIRGFADATLSTRDAQRQFQAAIDDAAASVKENGKTLDIGTEAGRKNQAALDAIAKTAKEAAAAVYEQTGSQESATDAIQAGRDALIKQLAALGITGDKAEAYADQLGLIPDNIDTVVNLDTSKAQKNFDAFFIKNNGKTIAVNLNAKEGRNFASGGYTGDGGKFQPAGIVHAGEFVVRSEVVPANRGALEMLNASGRMPGYASGGYVERSVNTTHKIEINATGVDPGTVTELLVQRLRTVGVA